MKQKNRNEDKEMKKPMIALTARSGDFDGQTRIFDNQTYFDAIAQAGGIPVLVTYGDDEDYKMIAERFDGLMVTGGEDLDPALFHQPAHPSLELTDPRLDTLDLRLIQLFAAKGKPILGICRGIQSINVAFGGTLIQDLNTQYPAMRAAGHQQHKAVPKPAMDATFHDNTFVEGTKLYAMFGPCHAVNSYHHQNIDQVADGFVVSSWSEDGLAEAIEKDQILAVQWHPERLSADPCHRAIFESFIQECRK